MVKKYFIHFEITESQKKLLDKYFSRSGEMKSEFFRKQIFNIFNSNQDAKEEPHKAAIIEKEYIDQLINENTDLKAQIMSYKNKVGYIQTSFDNSKELLLKIAKYVDQEKLQYGFPALSNFEKVLLTQIIKQTQTPNFKFSDIPTNFFTFMYHQKQISLG